MANKPTTPNDQRSDSKNPKSQPYKDDQANRAKQGGGQGGKKPAK